MKTLSLSVAQVQELIKIAKDALPNECCAFLLSEYNQSGKVAIIVPMRNVDESPVSFSIDPTELLSAYNLAESKGMEVTAIFHSHPAEASPSRTDIKYMQINPIPWLIYSNTENEIRAFLYDNDVISEISINTIDARV